MAQQHVSAPQLYGYAATLSSSCRCSHVCDSSNLPDFPAYRVLFQIKSEKGFVKTCMSTALSQQRAPCIPSCIVFTDCNKIQFNESQHTPTRKIKKSRIDQFRILLHRILEPAEDGVCCTQGLCIVGTDVCRCEIWIWRPFDTSRTSAYRKDSLSPWSINNIYIYVYKYILFIYLFFRLIIYSRIKAPQLQY
jgi:hypothetical protein